jgi:hypothetical protein
MSRIKTIGHSGQLSLGKAYAGRTVIIDTPEEGVDYQNSASHT